MTRILASAIALTLLGAGAAQAGTANVRYADLNLRSAAGQAELDRRIESAARRVCEIAPLADSRIADRSERNRCKADVRAQVTAALPA
ncbi:MAG: UrcA family protein [Novosphingobium sp.]